MTFTKRIDSAFTLCIAIAQFQADNGGEPASAIDLSKATGISISYIEQLVAPLRRAGIVFGVRGPGGGYGLKDPAESIKIGDIMAAGRRAWVERQEFDIDASIEKPVNDLRMRMERAINKLSLMASA